MSNENRSVKIFIKPPKAQEFKSLFSKPEKTSSPYEIDNVVPTFRPEISLAPESISKNGSLFITGSEELYLPVPSKNQVSGFIEYQQKLNKALEGKDISKHAEVIIAFFKRQIIKYGIEQYSITMHSVINGRVVRSIGGDYDFLQDYESYNGIGSGNIVEMLLNNAKSIGAIWSDEIHIHNSKDGRNRKNGRKPDLRAAECFVDGGCPIGVTFNMTDTLSLIRRKVFFGLRPKKKDTSLADWNMTVRPNLWALYMISQDVWNRISILPNGFHGMHFKNKSMRRDALSEHASLVASMHENINAIKCYNSSSQYFMEMNECDEKNLEYRTSDNPIRDAIGQIHTALVPPANLESIELAAIRAERDALKATLVQERADHETELTALRHEISIRDKRISDMGIHDNIRNNRNEVLHLPDAAPELFAFRTNNKSENIIDFLERVWGPWMDSRVLTRRDLRRLDKNAATALDNWLRKNELPSNIWIPTAKEINSRRADEIGTLSLREAEKLAAALRRRA